MPSYLEFSMENLSREQQKLREQMAQAFGPEAFQAMEEQVRTNMTFFTEAMRMFSPFAKRDEGKDGDQTCDRRQPPGDGRRTTSTP